MKEQIEPYLCHAALFGLVNVRLDSGHYTQAEVGEAYGVSYATVSRAVKEFENSA